MSNVSWRDIRHIRADDRFADAIVLEVARALIAAGADVNAPWFGEDKPLDLVALAPERMRLRAYRSGDPIPSREDMDAFVREIGYQPTLEHKELFELLKSSGATATVVPDQKE